MDTVKSYTSETSIMRPNSPISPHSPVPHRTTSPPSPTPTMVSTLFSATQSKRQVSEHFVVFCKLFLSLSALPLSLAIASLAVFQDITDGCSSNSTIYVRLYADRDEQDYKNFCKSTYSTFIALQSIAVALVVGVAMLLSYRIFITVTGRHRVALSTFCILLVAYFICALFSLFAVLSVQDYLLPGTADGAKETLSSGLITLIGRTAATLGLAYAQAATFFLYFITLIIAYTKIDFKLVLDSSGSNGGVSNGDGDAKSRTTKNLPAAAATSPTGSVHHDLSRSKSYNNSNDPSVASTAPSSPQNQTSAPAPPSPAVQQRHLRAPGPINTNMMSLSRNGSVNSRNGSIKKPITPITPTSENNSLKPWTYDPRFDSARRQSSLKAKRPNSRVPLKDFVKGFDAINAPTSPQIKTRLSPIDDGIKIDSAVDGFSKHSPTTPTAVTSPSVMVAIPETDTETETTKESSGIKGMMRRAVDVFGGSDEKKNETLRREKSRDAKPKRPELAKFVVTVEDAEPDTKPREQKEVMEMPSPTRPRAQVFDKASIPKPPPTPPTPSATVPVPVPVPQPQHSTPPPQSCTPPPVLRVPPPPIVSSPSTTAPVSVSITSPRDSLILAKSNEAISNGGDTSAGESGDGKSSHRSLSSVMEEVEKSLQEDIVKAEQEKVKMEEELTKLVQQSKMTTEVPAPPPTTAQKVVVSEEVTDAAVENV